MCLTLSVWPRGTTAWIYKSTLRCNEEREIIFNFGLILIDYLRDKFITVHNQMSENPTVNCSAVVSRVRKDRVLFGRFGLHVS